MPRPQAKSKIYNVPYLGFGVGLRPEYYSDFIDSQQPVDWLEIIAENYLLEGTRSNKYLDQIRERYPIVSHGVSLSIGSADALDFDYLKRLKVFLDRINSPWFSDHLCWTHLNHKHMHNLLPLPYTEETARYVAERIRIVMDFMERPFIIENLSSYIEFTASTMSEWEFINRIMRQANCGILLDINNIFVSATNHHFDPMTYLNAMPPERVIQYHIAGHTDKGTFLFDSHDHDICPQVWDLFGAVAERFGDTSLMIERDDHMPPLSELLAELAQARRTHAEAHSHAKVA